MPSFTQKPSAIENVTKGTAKANKALITDSNNDITGFRNMTSNGDINVENSSNALMKIKSTNTSDGTASVVLIGDDETAAGDGYSIKCDRKVLKISSDHNSSGTYNETILSLASHDTDASKVATITGACNVTDNITAYSSDKRLKKDIVPIETPLTKLHSLSGFTYHWDLDKCKEAGFEPKNEEQIGVFAQDVQSVIPQAVKPAPFDSDGQGGSKSGDNYLTVQYDKIVPLLIESIKEQQQQINALQERVELLEKK